MRLTSFLLVALAAGDAFAQPAFKPLGDGWKVAWTHDGSHWLERKVQTLSRPTFGVGLGIFAASFLAGIIGGAISDPDGLSPWAAAMPVFGAIGNAAMCCRSGGDRTGNAMWAVDAVVQAGSFIM